MIPARMVGAAGELRRLLAAMVLAVLIGGCASSAPVMLRLTAKDNDPALLAQALARRSAPAEVRPRNQLGKPLAFLVANTAGRSKDRAGTRQVLIGFDLAGQRELWRVETEVASRIEVGSTFLVHLDRRGKLVGRDVGSGKELWAVDAGTFQGAAADAEQVYHVARVETQGSTSGPVWRLYARDGRTGAERWHVDAPGQLGAPAAQGGLVYSPFLTQWLIVQDARTGAELARIRGVDEQISFVHPAGREVYFGSHTSVFLLDERAAAGTRAGSTHGRAALPEALARSQYARDAFDPAQLGYSVHDRNRVLWRGVPGRGTIGFAGDRVAVLVHRFLLGLDATSGELAWAYSHPQVDLVSAAHTGPAIAFVSFTGDVGALEPGTGRMLYAAKVDAQVLGAAFDAEGWQPAPQASREAEDQGGTVSALLAIARDRDARFQGVKQLALKALVALPGSEVTRELVALIQGEHTLPALREQAAEVLAGRRDAEGLTHVIAALRVPHDYLAGTAPRAIAVLARAMARRGTKATEGTAGAAANHAQDAVLEPAQRAELVAALLLHLQAPETTPAELVEVIAALAAVGQGAELPALRSFVLVYRADPAFAVDIGPVTAAIDALLRSGGAAEHELVAFVAEDARTQPAVAAHARAALAQWAAGQEARPRP